MILSRCKYIVKNQQETRNGKILWRLKHNYKARQEGKRGLEEEAEEGDAKKRQRTV